MNHVYRFEDGTFLTPGKSRTTDMQQAAVGTKARVAGMAGARKATLGWQKERHLRNSSYPTAAAEYALAGASVPVVLAVWTPA